MSEVMKKVTAADYFGASQQWCWHWAEGLNVIEWKNYETLVYREDLLAVMKEIQISGLPHINTLLFVLAACRLSPEELKNKEELIVNSIKYWGEHGPTTDFGKNRVRFVNDAFAFLKHIAQLPESYRSGKARAHLLQSLPELFLFNAKEAQQIVIEFESGRADEQILANDTHTLDAIKSTFEILAELCKRITSPKHLAHILDTGLAQLPLPLQELSPEPVKDLLGSLQHEQETEGIASLTQAILKVFRIPPLSVSNDDQQLGGVSDISNRGPLHRLLLSELANDDDLLMARLANNEAMYLRRESPPNTPERRRILLIDTSLPLWGKPRVFAVAAALACAQQNKHISSTEAVMLVGTRSEPVPLHTPEGVRKALTQLQPALHSGDALLNVLRQTSKADEEYILITAEPLLHDPDFLARLLPVQEKLAYLIAVNRNGRFTLYRCSASGREELLAATFDLDQLLFPERKITQNTPAHFPNTRKKKRSNRSYPEYTKQLPAFFEQEKIPLLFAAKGCKIKAPDFYYAPAYGIVVINDNRRILFFPNTTGVAGYELHPCMNEHDKPQGNFHLWHFSEHGELVLGYHDKENQVFRLLLFSLTGNETKELIIPGFYGKQVWMCKQGFANWDGGMVEVYDVQSGSARRMTYNDALHTETHGHLTGTSKKEVKKRINPGYSAFDTQLFFALGDQGRLFADQKVLVCENDKLYWREAQGWDRQQYNRVMLYDKKIVCTANLQRFEIAPLQAYNRADTGVAEWPDGSVIIQDHRGFIHFRSANRSIPDFSIVSISETDTTVWISNGMYAGNALFVPPQYRHKRIDVREFMRTCLEPFLQNLRNR